MREASQCQGMVRIKSIFYLREHLTGDDVVFPELVEEEGAQEMDPVIMDFLLLTQVHTTQMLT